MREIIGLLCSELVTVMNSRELATFILLGLAVVLALSARSTRPSALGAAKSFFNWKIAVPLLAFGAWTTALVWLAAKFEFWTNSLTGSTLLWFLFVGFVWFLHIGEAGKDPDFLKRRMVEAVGLGAFLECFVSLEVLPLYLEFPLLVFTAFVAMLDAFAKNHDELKPAARLTSIVLVLIGVTLLFVSIEGLVDNKANLDGRDVLNQFLLPMWLTIGAVPYVYAVALWAGYESLMINFKIWNDRQRVPLRVGLGAAVELRGSLVDVAGFRGMAARRAVESNSFAGARAAVREFKEQRAADRTTRAAARRRLEQNTGVVGVDEDGLVLDRREFRETKESLEWLA